MKKYQVFDGTEYIGSDGKRHQGWLGQSDTLQGAKAIASKRITWDYSNNHQGIYLAEDCIADEGYIYHTTNARPYAIKDAAGAWVTIR